MIFSTRPVICCTLTKQLLSKGKLHLSNMTFLSIANSHANLTTIHSRKQYIIIDKKYEKEIDGRSALKNKYLKHRTNLNWKLYGRQRNKCIKARKPE